MNLRRRTRRGIQASTLPKKKNKDPVALQAGPAAAVERGSIQWRGALLRGLGWTRAWVDVGYGEGWRGDGGDVASEIVPVRAARPQSARRPNLSPLNQKPSTLRDPD